VSDNHTAADQVAVHGRITVENSGEMRATLGNALRAKPAVLHVNLSDVSYIDTSGVATLVEAARIARKQGNRMILEGLHEQPRYLLEVTHLDHLFDIAGQEIGK
jgi:anti-sigma B factor antagonist